MIPTISVVTPSYNQGDFIEETIRSVLSQEGEFYLDYIIVDGGSTDDSVEVIKKYDVIIKESKWPVRCGGIRYRWLSEPDRGQSSAINKGFRMATGEVVAWLNSDDYYAEGALSSALAVLSQDRSLAMIYGDGYLIDKEGSSCEDSLSSPLFDLWKLIHLYDYIVQPSVFMYRSALEKAGLLNEDLHYIMDWELWLRLSRYGRIRHVPVKLSFARTHPGTKTGSAGLERWKEIRCLARCYGGLKWPPVVITQFFHKPFQLAIGGHTKKNSDFFSTFILAPLRRCYYFLIGGNTSGLWPDGYAERRAFLSVPLRKEASKIIIMLRPAYANKVRYFVGNEFIAELTFGDGPAFIKIGITDIMKKHDFLHIRLVSDKNGDPGAPSPASGGEVSFIIEDIIVLGDDGKPLQDIAVPEFHK